MARNALVLGELTVKDIAKTYDIPLSTIIGMKGYLGSRGKLTGKNEEEHDGSGRLPVVEWRKPASGQPNGDAGDQKIERMERQLEEIRALLQESGIEKAVNNAENMAYFDYSKSALGFEGDFGDLVNDCIKWFFMKHGVRIKPSLLGARTWVAYRPLRMNRHAPPAPQSLYSNDSPKKAQYR